MKRREIKRLIKERTAVPKGYTLLATSIHFPEEVGVKTARRIARRLGYELYSWRPDGRGGWLVAVRSSEDVT